ncbi:ChaN family lipoprotein [Nitrincola alkalisediminis]|uniref:ChaN family lipoprotein n=1 Tax=Nitrincola alkalisediminis TaxID=1366656 RepID=UPI0018736107|nr:ChaN family lipoprotein [Nitrincola alkalisediminis]
MMPRLLNAVCLSLLLASLPIGAQWLAPEHQSHPLVGQLWYSADNQFTDLDELIDRLPPGSWLLVGELHDNPDHHQLQTQLIEALAAQSRLGSVAFEMATSEIQPELDTWLGRGQDVTPEDLGWNQGWGWSRYEAQVRAALDHAGRVVGADLPRDAQRKAYQTGSPEGILDHAHSEFMKALLFSSHCEQLPREHLDNMLQVQLARDQHMAQRLAQYRDKDKVNVFIAGAIHAHRDLGVPRWMHASIPVKVVLLSALSESTTAQTYLPVPYPGFPLAQLSADILWFTPANTPQDYCAAFK